MARDRHITLEATPEYLLALGEALHAYAEAAWPPGGSDCAQASREALNATADSIIQAQQITPGHAEISRRQKATIRAALEHVSQLAEFEDRQEIYQTLLLQLTTSRHR